ncbi:MAG: tetratricopeptide repeat protein [Anaerolineae bacterium]|nr:tetratricopeptide repeat protein [Anaerolineae bacterium]
MSKRRSRRKSSDRSQQGLAVLRNRGHQAFQRSNYDQAIETWERLQQQSPDTQLVTALAEAYFRRGVEHVYSSPPELEMGIADLHQATELCPDEARYLYHLGLASHRAGDLDTAIRSYKQVRDCSSELATRAAYPLALALLQNGEDPSTDKIWDALTDKQRAILRSAETFRRRPYTVAVDAPLLWQGFAALDGGDLVLAHKLFTQVCAAPPSAYAANLAHYYLGVLAAQQEDFAGARREWTTAAAGGLRTLVLTANLAELYHQLAEERLLAGDVEGALDAANEAIRHTPDDKALQRLQSQAYQRLGYQAASAGDWEAATRHWQIAYDLEGGSFRLAYNLALADERAEDYISAGDTWREALRRRPRRADHPDAITDEQVAQLWKRAAEAYIKAGEYEEAIHVYKQAVKWNPEHLETRLDLVDGLINDGRLGAAQNEINRILEKDPDHVPALLRMAEVLAQSDYWWYASGAERYWRRVLELEPNNQAAIMGLVDYYMDLGDGAAQWGRYDTAISRYQQALELQPQNGKVMAVLGGYYFNLGDQATALSYLDKALVYGKGNLEVYQEIITIWLAQNNEARAWEVMSQAETMVSEIPLQFYLFQAMYCLQINAEDMARPWLDRVLEKASPEDKPLLMIAEMLMTTQAFNLAESYLQRALAENQEPGHVYILLTLLEMRRSNKTQARRYLGEAKKIARKTHDQDLESRASMMGELLALPPELLGMALMGGPLGLGPMGTGPDPGGFPFLDFEDGYNLFDEEFDDDEDDFDFFGF